MVSATTKKVLSALLVIAILIFIYFFAIVPLKQVSESYRYRRGPWMDYACTNYDCSTEEGKAQAIRDCQASFEKTPAFSNLKAACANPDPEIRKYSCPESCDPADVSAYVQYKGNVKMPACVDDPTHPDKTVDGVTYCWSDRQNYIVKPKPTTSTTPSAWLRSK